MSIHINYRILGRERDNLHLSTPGELHQTGKYARTMSWIHSDALLPSVLAHAVSAKPGRGAEALVESSL